MLTVAEIKRSKANYDRILKLVPDLLKSEIGDRWKFTASGFMDLSVEIINREADNIYIALSHYYEQAGDLVADPDMELKLMTNHKMVLPIAFQQAHIYRRVFSYDEKQINRKELTGQSQFLSQWLRNIKSQGHQQIAAQKDQYTLL